MIELPFRFPTPPPASPSTRPALGVALALNMLLAAGVHLGMAFGVSVQAHDELSLGVMRASPLIYMVLLLPIAATYGMAAAAWTVWSWWRVPAATLAGATLALGLNGWAMAHWIARQGWTVNPILAANDPRINHLMGLAGFSALVGPFMAGAMRRANRNDLAALRSRLEAGP